VYEAKVVARRGTPFAALLPSLSAPRLYSPPRWPTRSRQPAAICRARRLPERWSQAV